MLANFGVFPILRSWKLDFFINTLISATLCKILNAFHISQKRLDGLGHFRVPKPLAFKMRPSAQPFCENEFYSHKDDKSFSYQRPGAKFSAFRLALFCGLYANFSN